MSSIIPTNFRFLPVDRYQGLFLGYACEQPVDLGIK